MTARLTVELTASNLTDFDQVRGITKVRQEIIKELEYVDKPNWILDKPKFGARVECDLTPKRHLSVEVDKDYWEFDFSNRVWVDLYIEGRGYRVTVTTREDGNQVCTVELFDCMSDLEDGGEPIKTWSSEDKEAKYEVF